MLNVLHLLVRFGAPQIFHLFVCFDFSLLLVLLGMCLFLFFNHYYSHLYFSSSFYVGDFHIFESYSVTDTLYRYFIDMHSTQDIHWSAG